MQHEVEQCQQPMLSPVAFTVFSNYNNTPQQHFSNPIQDLRLFYRRIVDKFGIKFTLMLVSSCIGVKGFVLCVVDVGQVPLYKDYLGISADRFQSLKTVSYTPWAAKALIGALSDSLPIFGYHKRSYIILTCILGTAALVMLASISKDSAPELAASMFLIVMIFIVTTDLLMEGKYAELMRKNPESGSDLVSWSWGLVMFGTLLGSALAGPLSDAGYPRLLFWICVPFSLQVLIPLLNDNLPEQRIPPESRGFRLEKLQRYPMLFFLGFFVACGALVIAIVGELCSPIVQVTVSWVISIVACILAQYSLPKVLANANLYLFLTYILYIQVNSATDYFFLATVEQLPEGPHFSTTYYFTFTAIVGALAGIAGVSIFQMYLSKGSFRYAFWTTTLIQCLAAMIDVCIVKRWNVQVLGISDSWFYMLGDAMIGNVISMMNFMPSLVLTSKVCPKGLESLVYALLAGFQNFGGSVASYTGSYIIQRVGINTDPNILPWNFNGLAELLVVCHMILPLLSVPLTFFLIPNANMTDEFLGEEEAEEHELTNINK